MWNSKARKNATGTQIVWDGNKLVWSSQNMNEIRIMVDLDVEDIALLTLEVAISCASVSHLRRSTTPHSSTAERSRQPVCSGAINFMDHLLREGPSQNTNLVAVKHSFIGLRGVGFKLKVWFGRTLSPYQFNRGLLLFIAP